MDAVDGDCEYHLLGIGIPGIQDVESAFAFQLEKRNEANVESRRANDDVKFM